MKSLYRVVATAAAVTLAFPAAAGAQQAKPAPTQGSELPTLTVDQLEDMKVVNDKGEKIGEIDEIVRSKTNKDNLFAVVDVGGFLGIGDREVLLSIRDMSKRGNDLAAPAGTTKAQLEKLPKYDKDQFVELPDEEVVTIGSHTHTGGR